MEVLLDITISSKKRLFEEVALCIEEKYGVPRSETFEALFAREKLGSTNIGHGIALPHGRLVKLKRFVGVFARLEKPIQFESGDNKPIQMIFALLTPEVKQQNQHLAYLAHLAEVFSEKSTREQLLKISDKVEIIKLLGK
ncbi:MAG: PTS sugar transporter subunit IIA [Proteobacteria bacterium]|nr:PTS sugar transporter subunit IIA [Pseudomonadota bacterium]